MTTEDNLEAILGGQAVSLTPSLDVTPHSSHEDKFIPMTKTNMCYIVGGVIFDDSGRVLMIQEAKKSCRGQWYLPLGRLERGETFLAGAQREVKEEAGIDVDFSTLLSVEMTSCTWIRFIFYGQIRDDTPLKTPDQEDGESIQARMFSIDEIHRAKKAIRAGDVFKLVEAGRKYWSTEAASRRPRCMPVIAPHRLLIHRVVIIDRTSSSKQPINILVNSNGDADHIPTSLLNYTKDGHIAASVYAILRDAYGSKMNSAGFTVRMCGILGVEHSGTGELEDGVCLTSLVSLDLQTASSSSPVLPPAVESADSYHWQPLQNKELQAKLEAAAVKGQIVPLL